MVACMAPSAIKVYIPGGDSCSPHRGCGCTSNGQNVSWKGWLIRQVILLHGETSCEMSSVDLAGMARSSTGGSVADAKMQADVFNTDIPGNKVTAIELSRVS